MTKDEILELLHKAEALGLTSIEVEGLKAQFGKRPVQHAPVQDVSAEDVVKPLSVLDEYSDDEILYWSSPYFEELQSRKEKKDETI